jgi:hypothetical protein
LIINTLKIASVKLGTAIYTEEWGTENDEGDDYFGEVNSPVLRQSIVSW